MTLPIIAHPPSLVLHHILGDLGLRIVVEEKTGRGAPQPALGMPNFETLGIVQRSGDRTFVILWDVVACFAVRGDPFPSGGPSTSTLLDVGSNSAFLDWVRSDSHAEPAYLAAMGDDAGAGGELRHWRVSTLEALFDVAAIVPPEVKVASQTGN